MELYVIRKYVLYIYIYIYVCVYLYVCICIYIHIIKHLRYENFHSVRIYSFGVVSGRYERRYLNTLGSAACTAVLGAFQSHEGYVIPSAVSMTSFPDCHVTGTLPPLTASNAYRGMLYPMARSDGYTPQ